MQDDTPNLSPPRPRRLAPLASRRLPGLMAVLVALLALLIVPGVVERIQYGITRAQQRAEAEVAREQLGEMPKPANRFRLVAQSITPSVVGIKAVHVVGGGAMADEWFRMPLYEATDEGSGVIVDKAGYIVTNFHVISQANRVQVELADGQTIDRVTVIGRDPLHDLAVLKIRATGLVAAPWGNSDELEVGDEVLAVGNPFGFDRTITAGIISAKGRREVRDSTDPFSRFREYLQTDAAVNPGNSGGPLVNLKGEIVGINTAIVGPTFRGISFAIPSRIAKDVYDRLKAGGQVAVGWLGVVMTGLDHQTARQLGLREQGGALVESVIEDSPADRAGIQRGDVLVEWNGQAVADHTALVFLVAGTRPGSRVEVKILRNGRSRTLEVTVGERPLQLGR